jgi:hypothetical protein
MPRRLSAGRTRGDGALEGKLPALRRTVGESVVNETGLGNSAPAPTDSAFPALPPLIGI